MIKVGKRTRKSAMCYDMYVLRPTNKVADKRRKEKYKQFNDQ